MLKYLRRPFHIPDYEIISDCTDFLGSLYLQYGEYINDCECKNPYRITVMKENGGSYTVEHTAGKSNTNAPLLLLDNILFDTTTYDGNVIALHGAAVEYGGRAYVFLAPTTSGKTTLTAYLIYNNGFGYITEDCILIDRRTFNVYPYPCPIHLRIGGIDVLKKYGIEIPNMKLLDTHAGTKYIYTPDNRINTPVPLGGIYFMTRSETENSVTDITVSESIIELMKSGMTVNNLSGDYIRMMSQLARTGCKRLIYRDMEYVKDIIVKNGNYGHINADKTADCVEKSRKTD